MPERRHARAILGSQDLTQERGFRGLLDLVRNVKAVKHRSVPQWDRPFETPNTFERQESFLPLSNAVWQPNSSEGRNSEGNSFSIITLWVLLTLGFVAFLGCRVARRRLSSSLRKELCLKASIVPWDARPTVGFLDVAGRICGARLGLEAELVRKEAVTLKQCGGGTRSGN